mgnify:CR=1 FL=1
MTKPLQTTDQFNTLYETISKIIEDARKTVYQTANFAMVKAYWHIGKIIVEEEQNGKERAEYGQYLLKELSKKLTKKHGKSYSERNLRYVRQFYRNFQNWNAVRSELSWTHYRLLLRVEDDKAREFYLQETIDCNWSTRSLERQIGKIGRAHV